MANIKSKSFDCVIDKGTLDSILVYFLIYNIVWGIQPLKRLKVFIRD